MSDWTATTDLSSGVVNRRERTVCGAPERASRELLPPGHVADGGVVQHDKQAGRRKGVILTIAAAGLLGLLWWFDPAGLDIPLCSFHALTGLDCPGCGATRATHELLHGRLLAAMHLNALWVVTLPLALYLAFSELRVASGRKPLPGDLPRRTWFWLSLAATAIGFSVVRNLP